MAIALERKLKTIVRHFLASVVYSRMNSQIFEKNVFRNGAAEVVDVVYQGVGYRFTIADRGDFIQSIHASGVLYEQEELEIIRKYYDRGLVFVDVGANVGNHSMFAAMGLEGSRIVSFEPCLIQHTLLCMNAALNGVAHKTQIHKVALSDIEGFTWIYGIKENIASAHLRQLPSGELVRLARGDDFIGEVGSFFLKVDVEGHEMKVLEGFKQSIARQRPNIFIEVSNHNSDLLASWVAGNNYRVADRFKRYETNENFMLVPND